MTRDMWLNAPEHNDWVRRAPGCECDQEEGDSPCPVHGMNEEDDIDMNGTLDFEVEPR